MAAPDAPAAAAPIEAEPFRSVNALRAAHTALLRTLHTLDDEALPAEFIAKVHAFLARGEASGSLFDVDEDRADAQTLLNYWSTVLLGSGVSARPALLREFDAARAHALTGDTSPYVGLGTFQESDSTIFFGRRKLLQQMVGALERSRFIAVIGLSGSGKSSLVRAGLLPQIRAGEVADSSEWRVLEPMVPGSDPIGNLAAITKPPELTLDAWRHIIAANDDTFVGALGSRPVLLVVDQLEELFTLGEVKDAELLRNREIFVAQLVRLTRSEGHRHTVIATLRSDFEGALQRYPDLQALCQGEHVFRVSPLDPAGLRYAIERPAARQGVTFEKGLVSELMDEVLGEPAGLPLLQFALLKLWERREGTTITWKAYRELGNSVRAILADSASQVYESFRLEEDRRVVKALFRKLAVVGLGGEVTSHRASRAELAVDDAAPDRVERVVQTLVQAGLLRVTPGVTRATDQFEVTHEALLRNWPMLTEWLDEQREHKRKRLQLAAASDWWEANQEDRSGLLTGLRLEEAKAYRDLTPLEERFVKASSSAIDAWQRRVWAAALGALIAASLLLAFAGYQAWQARHARAEMVEIERATREARARFGTVQSEVQSLLADRTRARQELDALTTQLKNARSELQRSQEATANAVTVAEQRRTELQVVTRQLGDRPILSIDDGKLDLPDQWKVLGEHLDQIRSNASSSARIAILTAKGEKFTASGFLVGKDLLLCPWDDDFGSPAAAKDVVAEFTRQPAGAEPISVRVAGLLAFDRATDFAIFRLAREPAVDTLRPLLFEQSGAGTVGRAIYVLGNGIESVGVRVQPGYIVSTTDKEGFFNHDCQTVPGNMGAPVIDLASGRVIGVHWGGSFRPEDGPGVKRAVSAAVLDRVLKRALATSGGQD